MYDELLRGVRRDSVESFADVDSHVHPVDLTGSQYRLEKMAVEWSTCVMLSTAAATALLRLTGPSIRARPSRLQWGQSSSRQ